MEQGKSKSRKRKDLSEEAKRSGRLRLNGNGVCEGPFSPPVKDLRVHRIFPPVSTVDLDEVNDFTVSEKVFGSGVVGSLDQSELVRECVRTPTDEVLAKSKIVDGFNKACVVSPSKGFGRHVVGRRSPASKNLKQISSTKLFGNASSFSYRRLLPYLMDITKGALKSLEMKPQLPTSARNSVVESSLSALEPKVSYGTDLSPLRQRLSPSKVCEPIICSENTADTEVPLNSCLTDQDVLVSSSTCDLSYGQIEVSVNENRELYQSEAGNVADVLFGMDECGRSRSKDALDTVSSETTNDSRSVDSATQQSPDANRCVLMDVLEDDILCKSLVVVDVPPVEKNYVKYDEPQSNICVQNATKVVQETPLDDRVSISKDALGIARRILNRVSPNNSNSDHEQLVSEANITSSVEAISRSSSIESATLLSSGDSRTREASVLFDALSYQHLHLSDAYEAKKNDFDFGKSQNTICSQSNTELVHITHVIHEDVCRQDITDTVESVSKLENKLDDRVITNTENSVGTQFSGITDNKQSPTSERKLQLKPRQLKRFKNYNSVSYRKLLPYLTKIYKDSADSSNKGQVKIAGESFKKGHPTSGSRTTSPSGSTPISDASCDVEPHMTNFDRISEPAESPLESHLVNGLKSLNDLEFSSHVQDQLTQGLQPPCGTNDARVNQCVKRLQCTTSNFKEDDMTRIVKHSDDSNFVRVYPETTRGILKKNPKGCRGLCICLKCMSFRLHAEKAFEFKRSQLLDSEEIALELINELSLLRNLLKKSMDADSGETSQVQEALNKALVIEQHVKARFEQMNHDLQVHCQIPVRR